MRSPPDLRTGQRLHLVCLTGLLVFSWAAWRSAGSPSPFAFWTAAAFPVAHQVFVWAAWRIELQSSGTGRTLGFSAYLVLFFLLFAGRFISLFALAWIDRDSLRLPVLPQVVLVVLLALPGLYAMYSVARYFGMERAAGADHFDARYRDMPLVNRGIFRFTSNGMYLYAFLLFWTIAIGFDSVAALIVAAFSHAYIWVHYYATEKPDMDFLYRAVPPAGSRGAAGFRRRN